MKYRFILTIALFMAGVLLGIGLTGPEVYAAPEIPTLMIVKGMPNWLMSPSDSKSQSEYAKALYQEHIYEPLILRPQLAAVINRYNPRLAADERETIITEIVAASKRHTLDPLLVASVIAAESSFRVRARSRCDARGLMQITKWHEWRCPDRYDIASNIDTGCWYLKLNLDRFETAELALAAYNAGPGRARWALRHHPETRAYVPRVMGIYEGLKGAG